VLVPPAKEYWLTRLNRHIGALHDFMATVMVSSTTEPVRLIRRVAVATPKTETRRLMTNKTSATASDADRQAVLDVLKGVYEAWEANDAEAFVADYLDDASVVQPGVYKKDRQEIQSTMAGAFAGPLKGSHVIDQPQDVRFPSEDTAIVISEGGIVFPGQESVPSEGMVRATWVLAKRDGRWLIAAYHYSAAN
jgi:uncharacterized protein (TIGR02246 family)